MHKTPAQREIEACRHWLEEEIARVHDERHAVAAQQHAKAILNGA
jgi:uracil-DNA glycosylase